MADSAITFDRFIERYPTVSFTKGEIVVFQGETPRNAYVVREGTVKAYNLSVQGDEKPVDFYTSLDIFPVPWAFGKAPNAYFYYEAFTDVTLYTLPRQDFIEFLQGNPDYMYKLLNSFVMGYLGNSMRLNALQHSRASDKLLYTLHYLTLTHGREIGPRQVEITLSLTHQDFANLTGLTRETAATELNKLKTAGVIEYGKHTLYQVELDKLQHVINDQFIADVEASLKQ
ncbi:MAG: Crp/Fnr family transcriptional regulator [Candidatus Saccharibacteria bacterium]|nr:Crp/Fnr family transcriptional regulator [Candidatus Saccharibacteria bacterium]